VVSRTTLVGPGTRALATFVAEPDDRGFLELFETVETRASTLREGRPEWLNAFAKFVSGAEASQEWLRPIGDLLSGAQISKSPDRVASFFPLRGTALVEADDSGKAEIVYVLSLNRKANLLARMLLGIADSEREKEGYRGEKIILRPGGYDLAMAHVGRNLVISPSRAPVRAIIDRLRQTADRGQPAEALAHCMSEIDPAEEMPGLGAVVNDRGAVGALWRMATGAPEGAEIALPEDFVGAGFRFTVVSADVVKGDGSFYFGDEEAAAGGVEVLRPAFDRLLRHIGLDPSLALRREGSRVRVAVEARGVQKGLDHLFGRFQGARPAR
jgi:hypothetical protein